MGHPRCVYWSSRHNCIVHYLRTNSVRPLDCIRWTCRGRVLEVFAIALRPKEQAKPHKENSRQEQKERRLLEPCDCRNCKGHREPKKTYRQGQQINTREDVPSASNINRTKLIAGGGSMFRTPGSSTMFIVTRKVAQCSAWVQINRRRDAASEALFHCVATQPMPISNRQKFPITDKMLLRNA